MAYRNFKYLPRGTASGKVLRDKAFSMMNVDVDFFINFFDKKSSAANISGGAVTCARSGNLATQNTSAIKSKVMLNQPSAE